MKDIVYCGYRLNAKNVSEINAADHRMHFAKSPLCEDLLNKTM